MNDAELDGKARQLARQFTRSAVGPTVYDALRFELTTQEEQPEADRADLGTILVLSLWQPHASLIAPGYKTRETRDWPAPRSAWGQVVAIHAAKRFEPPELRLCQRPPFRTALAALGLPTVGDLPLGAVVSVAMLVDCRQVAAYDQHTRTVVWMDGSFETLTEADAAFGNYSSLRWIWNFTAIRRLPAPIPARGHQQLWRWSVPPAVLPLLS